MAATVPQATGSNLPAPAGHMNLGTVTSLSALTEHDDAAQDIFNLVNVAREFCGDDYTGRAPMDFGSYCNALRNIKILRSSPDRAGPAMRRFISELYDVNRHTPNMVGFTNYVAQVHPTLERRVAEILRDATKHIGSEAELGAHAIILGGSGSGKSELLKLIIHHHVLHPQLGAVVILDPHGKIAREVARWREFAGEQSNRLVYFDAMAFGGKPGAVPGFNPLAVAGADDFTKDKIAAQLADAIGVLREGDAITGNMVTVAKRCLRVLLDKPDATLVDFKNLLQATDREDPLIKRALASTDENHRDWFARNYGGFSDPSYQSARVALIKRVDDGLFPALLRNVFTSSAPIDLRAAIEARQIICFNLATLGENEGDMLGRLVMAQLASLGHSRISEGRPNPPPVRVFVDEATRLMSPSVFTFITQLRKVNMSLVMGQQDFGAGAERNLVRGLRSSTAVKIAGGGGSLDDALELLGWEHDRPRLKTGKFVVAWGNGHAPAMLNTLARSELANDNNAMSESEWEQVLEQQRARFYSGAPLSPARPIEMPATLADDEDGGWTD